MKNKRFHIKNKSNLIRVNKNKMKIKNKKIILIIITNKYFQ